MCHPDHSNTGACAITGFTDGVRVRSKQGGHHCYTLQLPVFDNSYIFICVLHFYELSFNVFIRLRVRDRLGS